MLSFQAEFVDKFKPTEDIPFCCSGHIKSSPIKLVKGGVSYLVDTCEISIINKTKVIRADLLDFAIDLDLYFEGFGNFLVVVTFQFWLHFSFDDVSVLMTF